MRDKNVYPVFILSVCTSTQRHHLTNEVACLCRWTITDSMLRTSLQCNIFLTVLTSEINYWWPIDCAFAEIAQFNFNWVNETRQDTDQTEAVADGRPLCWPWCQDDFVGHSRGTNINFVLLARNCFATILWVRLCFTPCQQRNSNLTSNFYLGTMTKKH